MVAWGCSQDPLVPPYAPFLEIRMLFPPGVESASVPGGSRTCFWNGSESPSCSRRCLKSLQVFNMPRQPVLREDVLNPVTLGPPFSMTESGLSLSHHAVGLGAVGSSPDPCLFQPTGGAIWGCTWVSGVGGGLQCGQMGRQTEGCL